MSTEQFEQLVNDIRDIKICLLGDLSKPECGTGIVSEIKSISNWRAFVNKVLWSITGFCGSLLLVFIASIL